MNTKKFIENLFLLLIILFSCDNGDTDSEVVVTMDSSATNITVVENNLEPEQLDTTTVTETKETIIQQLNGLAKQMQMNYNKLSTKQNHYAENIAFETFLGKPIEAGELEIRKIGTNLVWVYADYFDGSPIGGKRFYVENGNLFMVEIIRLYDRVTEQGSVVTESKTHTFYYQNKELIQVFDHKKNEVVAAETIPWAAENLKDWELVNLKIK